MIPNMIDTIQEFEQSLIYVQNVVIDDSGFSEDVIDPVETNINGVVQIPQDETLQSSNLDFSKNYRQVHITTLQNITPKNNDYIKYKNKNYRIVRTRDFKEYGYYEFIIEEVLNGGY